MTHTHAAQLAPWTAPVEENRLQLTGTPHLLSVRPPPLPPGTPPERDDAESNNTPPQTQPSPPGPINKPPQRSSRRLATKTPTPDVTPVTALHAFETFAKGDPMRNTRRPPPPPRRQRRRRRRRQPTATPYRPPTQGLAPVSSQRPYSRVHPLVHMGDPSLPELRVSKDVTHWQPLPRLEDSLALQQASLLDAENRALRLQRNSLTQQVQSLTKQLGAALVDKQASDQALQHLQDDYAGLLTRQRDTVRAQERGDTTTTIVALQASMAQAAHLAQARANRQEFELEQATQEKRMAQEEYARTKQVLYEREEALTKLIEKATQQHRAATAQWTQRQHLHHKETNALRRQVSSLQDIQLTNGAKIEQLEAEVAELRALEADMIPSLHESRDNVHALKFVRTSHQATLKKLREQLKTLQAEHAQCNQEAKTLRDVRAALRGSRRKAVKARLVRVTLDARVRRLRAENLKLGEDLATLHDVHDQCASGNAQHEEVVRMRLRQGRRQRARKMASEILQGISPYLGITFRNTVAPVKGILIQTVVDGSPADAAGILVGDIVTTVDQHDVQHKRNFCRMIEEMKPTHTAMMALSRVAGIGSGPGAKAAAQKLARASGSSRRPSIVERNRPREVFHLPMMLGAKAFTKTELEIITRLAMDQEDSDDLEFDISERYARFLTLKDGAEDDELTQDRLEDLVEEGQLSAMPSPDAESRRLDSGDVSPRGEEEEDEAEKEPLEASVASGGSPVLGQGHLRVSIVDEHGRTVGISKSAPSSAAPSESDEDEDGSAAQSGEDGSAAQSGEDGSTDVLPSRPRSESKLKRRRRRKKKKKSLAKKKGPESPRHAFLRGGHYAPAPQGRRASTMHL